MRHALIVAFAAIVSMPPSQAARAETPWPPAAMVSPIAPGSWYVGVGAAGGVVRPPAFRSGITFFSPAGTRLGGDLNVTATSGGGAVSLGYAFPDGALPAWAGRRARIEVSGGFASGVGTASANANRPGSDQVLQTSVDGTVVQGGALFITTNIAERLRIQRTAYTGRLRMVFDYDLSQDLRLSPFLGLTGGAARDQIQYRVLATNVSGAFPQALDERLTSSHIGGVAGLNLSWAAAGWLRLYAGGSVGPVWRRARLTASDCLIFGPTAGCPGAAAATRASTVSDTGSAVGVRTSLSAGFAVTVWGAVLQAGGFFSWDSAEAGVNNPTAAGVLPAGTNIGAARVRFAGAWNAGGYIMLRIPLSSE